MQIYFTPIPAHLEVCLIMTPNIIYRRQSMATLYDKLRAQDGEDHMAWLAEVTAEFDTENKPDLFVPSVPSPPSVISSGSSSASSSPPNLITPLDSNDQSEGESDSDSDSDSEIELIDNPDGMLFQCYDPIQYNPSNLYVLGVCHDESFILCSFTVWTTTSTQSRTFLMFLPSSSSIILYSTLSAIQSPKLRLQWNPLPQLPLFRNRLRNPCSLQ